MSLLADLLSRVKHEEQKSDVPPHLLRIVMDSSRKRRIARRYLIVAGFAVFIIVLGFGTVYFVDSVLKNVVLQKMAKMEQQSPPAPSAPPVQKAAQVPESPPPEAAKQEAPAEAPAPVPAPAPAPAPAKEPERVAQVPVKQAVPVAPKPAPVPAPTREPQRVAQAPVKQAVPVTPKPAPVPKEEPAPAPKSEPKPVRVTPKAQGRPQEAPQAPPAPVARQETRTAPVQREKPADQVLQTSDVRPAETERIATLFSRAQNYESQGDFRNALPVYQQILGREPRNVTVLNKVATLYLRLKQPEESLKYSKAALDAKADYVPALINLGIAHVQQGNLREGERFLVRAATVEPENKAGLLNLGLLYERLKEYDRAAEVFQRLAQLQDAQGYLGLGRAYELQKNYRGAENIYRAITASPDIDSQTKRYAQERLQALTGQR